jgi:hypothetical protein
MGAFSLGERAVPDELIAGATDEPSKLLTIVGRVLKFIPADVVVIFSTARECALSLRRAGEH